MFDENFSEPEGRSWLRPFMGMTIRLNRTVPKGEAVLLGKESVVVFHDQEDLHSVRFWLVMGPLLDQLAKGAKDEWNHQKYLREWAEWRRMHPPYDPAPPMSRR